MFNLKKYLLVIGFALCLEGLSSQARAEGSLNIGFENPPGSTVGLNYLYFWHHFAGELGLGYVGTNPLVLKGGANLKYLFLEKLIRPYLQVGGAVGVATGSGASVGVGSPYAGGGLFIKGHEFYIYGSYNYSSTISTATGFWMGGIGFSL